MALDDQLQQYQDQLNQLLTQQPTGMPSGTPDDGTRPSWTGLLGSVLSGGQAPGYKLRGSEADTSGNRALLNFGIQTLLASGPAPVRPDVFSAVASGLQGAQQSMDVDQRRAAALAAAQYGAAHQQQQDRLAALKEALPLLTLQQKAAAVAGAKPPWEGSSSTAAADTGFTGDKEKDRALIAQRESRGDPTALNYVAKEDPTAYERGATASGKYQFVNSTWAEGLKLAGIDPAKYARAMDAPEAVQDKVFDVIYDKYGTKPWQKGARDWVKDEQGRYQLATVRPPAQGPGGGAAPAPAPTASTPPATPTGPPGTVPRETQVVGADGQVHTVVRPVPAIAPGAPVPRPTAAPPGAQPAPDVAPGAGNQVAGPGAPSGGPVRPPGPGVAGDVNAIIGGMTARGASPTTLAPPPATAPGGPPAPAPQLAAGPAAPAPVPVAAPAGPPPATPEAVPDTFEEYQKQHPIVVPPNIQQLFKTTPAGQALDILQQQEANFRNEWTQAKANLDPAGMAKASEAINTVRAKQAELLQAADKQGGDAQAKYLTDQTNIQKEIWQKARDAKEARITAAQAAQQQLDRELQLERVRGDQQRLSNAQSADVARQEKRMEAIDTAGAASQAASGDLDMLRALSQTVGTTQPWTQYSVGGTRLQDWITKYNLGTPDFVGQMGNQQAYESALQKIIVGLRQGVSMGNLSDRDMEFFKNQVPDLMKQPETRENIINFLDQAHQRKVDYARLVNKYYRPGTVSVADAEERANTELGPLLKQPPAYTNLPQEARAPAQRLWLYKNVQPGSFFKDSNGKLKPYNPPPNWRPEGAEE